MTGIALENFLGLVAGNTPGMNVGEARSDVINITGRGMAADAVARNGCRRDGARGAAGFEVIVSPALAECVAVAAGRPFEISQYMSGRVMGIMAIPAFADSFGGNEGCRVSVAFQPGSFEFARTGYIVEVRGAKRLDLGGGPVANVTLQHCIRIEELAHKRRRAAMTSSAAVRMIVGRTVTILATGAGTRFIGGVSRIMGGIKPVRGN